MFLGIYKLETLSKTTKEILKLKKFKNIHCIELIHKAAWTPSLQSMSKDIQ